MHVPEEEKDDLDRLEKWYTCIYRKQIKYLTSIRKLAVDLPSALECDGFKLYGEAVMCVWRTAYEKLGKEAIDNDFVED